MTKSHVRIHNAMSMELGTVRRALQGLLDYATKIAPPPRLKAEAVTALADARHALAHPAEGETE